ncbi:MAG: hypothetical protein KF843_03580 [Flavobacteriales bacterium]|nr:hypothetical protein [Flavobacteriales bacterium]
MKTRIAPTPSGYLHAGNGAAFVLAWKLAREADGKLLLRIDDLDAERVRPEYVEDIFENLHWLGVDWDEGPRNAEELQNTWSQHLRMARYSELVEQLREGGHLYACTCSRKEVQDRTGSGEYDGHCRSLALPFDHPDCSWRLHLPQTGKVAWNTWPDGKQHEATLDMPAPVIRQRNGRPAYQIASLADDVDFGIDLVVRGADLLDSTAIQLYLAELLGLGSFSESLFLHHPLLLDKNGAKRSKSHGADSLKEARLAGEDPHAIHQLADRLKGESL